MNHDSPILLVLILMLLSACSTGYYIQIHPNQGVSPMETGKPEPLGTRMVSGYMAQSLGNDDLQHISNSEYSENGRGRGDKTVHTKSTRASFRASYQTEPSKRVGFGVTYSFLESGGHQSRSVANHITLFFEDTQYWSQSDGITHFSFYSIFGVSIVDKSYYYVGSTELDQTVNALSIDYYPALLWYQQTTETTGIRLGVVAPFTISDPSYVRAGLTSGIVINPSKRIQLNASISAYSKAVIVRVEHTKSGMFHFLYPVLRSSGSRQLVNSPYLDLNVGLNYKFKYEANFAHFNPAATECLQQRVLHPDESESADHIHRIRKTAA